ncbi:hypothetical protein P7D22_22490 [Lichenihabitans sp. Uapishka_5]|uniref:hypothetical protein n=1 Tax=Lichenihabitans sp. Uapishka_5 TaxID=3037302 RepID=UPI0029E80681|nr:hypothetical protein [Lichenihabitans sp. Uapishka_5]MDX7953927.1 hypothetical protein [Lichenihabitans sp. Uapishka_5]
MKLSSFVRGLEIMRTHYTDSDGYRLGAEHDQIHLFASDLPLTEEEMAELDALGWFQPEADDHDPEAGWSCFT